MPVKLETPAEQVDIFASEYATMLQNLQANIIKPHGRDFARHIFLQFTGTPAAVKSWIKNQLAPLITTAQQQFDGIARRKATPGVKADGGSVCGFFLSARGYQFLGLPTSGFASETFRKGMKDQSRGLIPRLVDLDNEDPPVSGWEQCFQNEIHALITVADDTLSTLESKAHELGQSVAAVAQVLGIEEGNVLRRNDEPVEHFGYLDGLSQPLFTKQDMAQYSPKHGSWDPSARLSLVLVDDPLSNEPDAFGSYLAYRKLGQDVQGFVDSVLRLAQTLAIAPDLAGAFVVGRFKNGTPVELASQPSATLSKLNDFNYDEDGHGARCPFHAHIRKANPRGTTPLMSLNSEKKHRIARRGIPYGPPIDGATADNVPPNSDPKASRGLLFMCFQSNIEDQFEFIQRVWVDNKHFPTAVLTNGLLQRDTGDDPLIGQDRDEAQRWPKQWGKHDKGTKAINFESAVQLEGGEYFFAPSLPFLKSL